VPHLASRQSLAGDRPTWRSKAGLVARIAVIVVFCGTAAYLTAAAFVPAMGTGGWDPVFAGFAALGILVSVASAAARFFGRGKAGEGKGQ
jgi:hypothetical protein